MTDGESVEVAVVKTERSNSPLACGRVDRSII